jgi:hypothetical protein
MPPKISHCYFLWSGKSHEKYENHYFGGFLAVKNKEFLIFGVFSSCQKFKKLSKLDYFRQLLVAAEIKLFSVAAATKNQSYFQQSRSSKINEKRPKIS